MNKSPEEYFKEQDFSAVSDASEASAFSPTEKAFMDKYLGMEAGDVLNRLGIPARGPAGREPDQHSEMAAERPLDEMLKSAADLLLVAFFIGGQEFTLPTVAVQEVIRYMPPAKLPTAPRFVAGVINLRGRVTPLIHLRDVLEVSSPRQNDDKFIVVCRRQGFQLGMIIERVHTMYRVPQEDIDWSIEAHIGSNVDFISGLLKLREKLVGIVSVDRVIASILA